MAQSQLFLVGGVGGVVCFFLNKILVVHHECVQLHLKEDILPSVTQDTHPPTHTKKQDPLSLSQLADCQQANEGILSMQTLPD